MTQTSTAHPAEQAQVETMTEPEMTTPRKQSDTDHELPATPMLDRAQQLRGWRLNKMAMSLGEPENRRAFRDDERAYLDVYQLTDDEIAAVTDRDWKRMIALGGNLFFLLKISAVDPVRMTEIGAAQVDMDHVDFLRDRLGKDV